MLNTNGSSKNSCMSFCQHSATLLHALSKHCNLLVHGNRLNLAQKYQ